MDSSPFDNDALNASYNQPDAIKIVKDLQEKVSQLQAKVDEMQNLYELK